MAVVSVAIDSIAAGGDGVGRTNGLVVFVPRTAVSPIFFLSVGVTATLGASSIIF